MKKFLITILALLTLAACQQAYESETSTESAQNNNHADSHMPTSSSDNPEELAQFAIGPTSEYETTDFNATEFLTTWNFNNLPEEERAEFYKETPLKGGTLLREYWLNVEEVTIEVAPGVFYPSWAYNGQVPGPTIRATEGDTIKIHFTNNASKPHTAHFHGFHSDKMDGTGGVPEDEIMLPGESRIYEFTAGPFGTHVYHCHSYPVSTHIARGLYGAYIVDPKNDTRPKPDKELVMVMNGFDTDFDGENDFYAVNTQAFAYNYHPIHVKKGELVRIHLSNMLEFDPINSFHLHANFFDEYPTGTKLEPENFTDTIIMGQAERSILDVRFRETGMYMFHSHVSELAELGWTGMFMVE